MGAHKLQYPCHHHTAWEPGAHLVQDIAPWSELDPWSHSLQADAPSVSEKVPDVQERHAVTVPPRGE
jgi:hypothetical protein